MGIIKTLYGEPSYTIGNDDVETYITVKGGHVTANFNLKGKKINPFFIAPWWNEKKYEKQDEIINVLRGDFFCFPFGGNDEPYKGKSYPVHGKTSNDCWDFKGLKGGEIEKEIILAMDLDEAGSNVEKHIAINKGEAVIYSKHVIKGFNGKIPIGHHPTIKLPDRENAGFVDISEPITGFTTPIPAEDPKSGGYSRLKQSTEIKDRSKVLCTDGETFDLTRYPTPKGYEDIVIFISNERDDFAYSSISLPIEGYLYFQLKDPRVLSETLFWMSNGGRHYPPWNGRVASVLGLEEITGFYHYGIKKSVDDNILQKKGFKTYLDINSNESFEVKFIMGLVPIERDFKGVQDIVRKDSSTITIIGKGKEKIDVPCKVDFLLKG